MVRRFLIALGFALPVLSSAQFVFPRPEYHDHDPKVYVEDPFVIHYRQEFFSVFRGDFTRFDKAFSEIEAMVRKDPKDARALVWLGNGETVKAGVLWMQGKQKESIALMKHSRPILDRAVELKPEDPGVFMMRAVTLYIQGQNWPVEEIPKENWEKLRVDCSHLVRQLGPKLAEASVHVRGETFGEMGIANLKLGDKEAARAAFEKVIELCPKTDYEERARKEIEKLGPRNLRAGGGYPEGSLVEIASIASSRSEDGDGNDDLDIIMKTFDAELIPIMLGPGTRLHGLFVPGGYREAALEILRRLISEKHLEIHLAP